MTGKDTPNVGERRDAARDFPPITPQLEALLEASPDAVLIVDRDGVIVGLNRRTEELFDTAAAELMGGTIEALLPERLRGRHAALRSAYSRVPTVRAMSTRPGLLALRADGTEFPVEVQLTPVLGSDAGLVMAVIHDVAARAGLARALEAPDRPVAALDAIGDAILTIGANGEVDFLNPAAERLTGCSCAAARGRRLSDLLSLGGQRAGEQLERTLDECLRTGRAAESSEVVLQHEEDGQVLDVSITPIRDRSGAVTGAAVVARDVTHARRIARQLSHQATHDALTGLVNRGEFGRRLERLLEGAAGEQAEHAVCLLDLDGFKRVNDSCGHLAGDELLRQLSELMRERMRSRDTLARLGGDEFGILLEHCRMSRAARIAEEIREAICGHRFVFEGQSYAVGVSIGIVPVRPDGMDPADILTAADSACYMAKRWGGSRIQLFDPKRDAVRPSGRRDWVRRVVAAIQGDRMRLWAQPVVPLDGAGARAPRLELLLRLETDQPAPLLPGAFLPAARRHGLMATIDRWVVAQAARQLADWGIAHGGVEPPTVSINLAEETVVGGEGAAMVREALTGSGVPPGTLCFEIGESIAASHLAASVRLVREVREAGCQVILEHCGSGMAAFTLLRRMPVDYLKLAGHIVRGSARDPVDRALVTALNEVGHALGLGTIGSEVESAEVLETVRQVGLDYAQGFEIRRPEPLTAALERLAVSG